MRSLTICFQGIIAVFMSIWEAESGRMMKQVWKIWPNTLCAPAFPKERMVCPYVGGIHTGAKIHRWLSQGYIHVQRRSEQKNIRCRSSYARSKKLIILF
jgi:hypothetical protein